jgi:5-methyltetrahydropteroyltriglutamate--homocysteine methyltransferase
MLGGSVVPSVPPVCTAPVKYRGGDALKRDIDNLKAAVANLRHHAVFMPAVAPSGVGTNKYYRSDEEFFHAVGAALHTGYQAIVDAGFLLQIDDPYLKRTFLRPASRSSSARCAGHALCRGDQRKSARNSARTSAPPHLLRHQ